MHGFKPFIGVALVALLLTAPAAAQIAPVEADRDTWLEQGQPDTGHGSDTELTAGAAVGDTAYALLHFDLGSLPPSTVVAKAVLKIHVTNPGPGSQLDVVRVTAPWTEVAATWNSVSADIDTSTWGSASVVVSGPLLIDVTALVQEWVDGSLTNNGLAVANMGAFESRFASRESATALQRPQLIVVTEDYVRNNYRVATGAYKGTGTASRHIDVGFRPDFVIANTEESDHAMASSSTMPANGTKDLSHGSTLWPDEIQSLDATGFNVGIWANQPGRAFHWVAFRAAAGVMSVQSYVGDGTTDRAITGVGFEPTYVMVMGDVNKPAHQRFRLEPFNTSVPMDNGNYVFDGIKASIPDGFTIGNNDGVNKAGTTYHYVAWNGIPGLTESGRFTGSGVDSVSVAVGFQADNLLLKNAQGGEHMAQRVASMGNGDVTLAVGNLPAYIDGIQALSPGGFEVGTHPSVNGAGDSIYWVAFDDSLGTGVAAADVQMSAAADTLDVVVGQVVGLTVRVRNAGPDSTWNVSVNALLPVGLSHVSHTATSGSYDAATGEWTVGELVTGETDYLEIDARVDPVAIGSSLPFSLTATSALPDPNSADNTDALTLTVVPAGSADVGVSKVIDIADPDPGQTVTYTITFSNAGPDTATSVVVTDLLPGGTVYISDVASAGAYDDATGEWTIGTVPDGAVETLTVTALIDSGAAGAVIANVASVTAMAESDPDSTNNVATAVASVTPDQFRVLTGTYTGTGVGPRAITGLGVRPGAVYVQAGNGQPTIFRTATMPAGVSKQLGLNNALLGDRILSLDPDGFSVGTAPGVNAFGVQYYWTAFCTGANAMTLGSYVGNGLDDRNLDIVGFEPDYVMLIPESNEHAMQRFGSQPFDESLPLHNDGQKSDRIQDFRPLGFQVGNHNTVNDNGVRYHYLAWKTTPGQIAQGTRTGTGVPESITGLGFEPSFITLKSRGGEDGVHRTGDSGAFTMVYPPDPAFSDGVTSLDPDGFQLGADDRVNKLGETFYWAAFQATPLVDLDLTMAVDNPSPAIGDTIRFDIDVVNLGPADATGIVVADALPAGLQHVADGASQGTYLPGSGDWTVGVIAAGDTARLFIDTRVAAGTGGSTIDNTAAVAQLNESDTDPLNNADTVGVAVQTTTIALTDEPGSLYPGETFAGQPDLKIRLGLNNPSSVGVELETTSRVEFSDGANTFTSTLANPTYIPAGAADYTVSFSPAAVPAAMGTGTLYPLAVTLVGTTDQSVAYAETLDTSGSNEISVSQTRVGIEPLVIGNSTVAPGARDKTLLALSFSNGYAAPRSLDSLTVSVATSGPGSAGQRDAETERLRVFADTDSTGTLTPADTPLGNGGVTNGSATFALGGAWQVPAAGVATLLVTADVDSFGARDGDVIDAEIRRDSDVVFVEPTVLDAITPLYPVNSFGVTTIDGMVSHQLSFSSPAPDTLFSGETDRLIATIIVPQNGYEADTLEAIELADASGSFDASDLSAIRLYIDDGDDTFDPLTDPTLGAMAYSGDRYELTGLSVPIAGSVRLFAAADVAANPTNGDRLRARVPAGGLQVASGNDGPVDAAVVADDDFVFVNVEQIDVDTQPLASATPRPGDSNVALLRLRLINSTLAPVALDSLTVENATAGPGAIADLDRAIARLRIYADDGNGVVDAWDTIVADELTFTSGTATAPDLGLTIDVGTPLHLMVVCDVDSFCASDLDTLGVRISDGASFRFAAPQSVVGDFPLGTATPRVIDGAVAHQFPVYASADSAIVTTPTDNLVFEFAAFGNGYQPDTLRALTVTNLGSATTDHLGRLALYADGGDGAFDAGTGDDVYLGDMTPATAKTFVLSSLSVPLSPCGLQTRLYVAADLEADPPSGASIQFAIPVMGVEVASGNDGPIDDAAADPSAQFVPKPNELTAFPYSVGNARVLPGTRDVLNLGIGFYNGFDTPLTLTGTDLFQQGTALSAEIDAVHAFADSDTNGLFDPAVDARIATVTSTSPVYSLDALSVLLPPRRISYLFVAYDLRMSARDSVAVNFQLNAPQDLAFSTETVDVQGEFPLNSPGVDFTDGMTAAQLGVQSAPEYRAAPNEDNVWVLGLIIPANGTNPDVLRSITVQNRGTAVAGQDISAVNLWIEDNGDASFDPLTDRLATSLPWMGSGWRNVVPVAEVIGGGGLRCYVTIDVTSTATDNRSVRMAVPIDGIQVESGNDGPIDIDVENANDIAISTDPLLTTIELDRVSYSVGQTITVALTARNAGVVALTGVHPSELNVGGSGVATAVSGPVPSNADLAPGVDTTFVWTFVADNSGYLEFCAGAFNSDSSEASQPTCTDAGVVHERPLSVAATLEDVAPPGANRGQQNVTLASVDLAYSGFDTLSAPVELDAVSLGIADGTGTPVAPSAFLKTLRLVSSTGVSYTVDTADSASSPMRVSLSPPITVNPDASINLDVTATIGLNASLSPFSLYITDAAAIELRDANDGAPVDTDSPEMYPWFTNPVSVSLPSETLMVSTNDTTTTTVNVGQTGALLYAGVMENAGPSQSADLLVTRVTLDVYDLVGNPLDPSRVIRSMSIIAFNTEQYRAEVLPGGTRIQCEIAQTWLLRAGTPAPFEIRVDARAFPDDPGFFVELRTEAAVLARDANDGSPAPVAASGMTGFPLRSRTLRYQLPATRLVLTGRTDSPETILPSSTDVRLVTLAIEHPDTVDASTIAVDSVAVEFVDPLGSPLFPGDWLAAMRLVRGGSVIASATTLSTTDSFASFRISPPILLSPNASDTIVVYVDAKGLVAPTRFYAKVDRQHIVAVDTNNGERILGIDGELPFLGGPFWLRIPGSDVFCTFDSRMPANVSGTEEALAAFDLRIENRNPTGYTDADLTEVTIGAEDRDGEVVAMDRLLSQGRLLLGDSTSVVGTLSGSDLVFSFSPQSLGVPAGEAADMRFDVDLAAENENQAFRFVIRNGADITLRDASTGDPIVATHDGGYPMATALAQVVGASAGEGFTNYPNPFAAGRDATTITFFLEQPGRVTLELYTLWGKHVATLLSGDTRPQGLHQDVTWDGRTADGDVVNNGVYYLVIDASYSSGGGYSQTRKIGVIR